MNSDLLRDLKLLHNTNFIVHLDAAHHQIQFCAVKVGKPELVYLKFIFPWKFFLLHEEIRDTEGNS